MATEQNLRERITIQPKDATKEHPRTTVVSRRAFERIWKDKGYKEVENTTTAQVTEPTVPNEGDTKTKTGKGS